MNKEYKKCKSKLRLPPSQYSVFLSQSPSSQAKRVSDQVSAVPGSKICWPLLYVSFSGGLRVVHYRSRGLLTHLQLALPEPLYLFRHTWVDLNNFLCSAGVATLKTADLARPADPLKEYTHILLVNLHNPGDTLYFRNAFIVCMARLILLST